MAEQGAVDKAARLRAQIGSLEQELSSLKQQLAQAEDTLDTSYTNGHGHDSDWEPRYDELHTQDYTRYGRQMILPGFGAAGQARLARSRVLIIGAGGLGCPAAMYLAAAGVTLDIMDGDTVELSNLHRQVLHSADRISWNKAASAKAALSQLNPRANVSAITEHFTMTWALEHLHADHYDLVLDCTDRAATRYMISDAALLGRVPLITAAALRTDGQLLVLNNPPAISDDSITSGPCYRCVFPRPPPAASNSSCSEAGVLGPVVGTMGTLMAVAALKLVVYPDQALEPQHSMLIYSMHDTQPFRQVRIKGRRADCAACSKTPRDLAAQIKQQAASYYDDFCGSCSVPTLSAEYRIGPRESSRATNRTLIDVRDKTEFDIAHLHGAVNVPLDRIKSNPEVLSPYLDDAINNGDNVHTSGGDREVHFVCRLGNDSREAVQRALSLQQKRQAARAATLATHQTASSTSKTKTEDRVKVLDVKGGLRAWILDVDPTFPIY